MYITGIGCVTSLGVTPKEFYKSITQMDITIKDSKKNLQSKIENFRLYDRALLSRFYKMDRSCQYLLEAVNQALKSAPLLSKNSRVGVVVGSIAGPINAQRRFVQHLEKTGKPSSILFQQTANNIFSGIISCVHNFTGFNVTIYNGLTSSLDALEIASMLIKSKQLDAVVVAAVDTILESANEKVGCCGDLTHYESAAAIIVEPQDVIVNMKKKIFGKVMLNHQRHLYDDKEKINYLKDLLIKYPKTECLLSNSNRIINSNESTLSNNANRLLSKIESKKYIGGFGAVDGLLQIIFGILSNNQSVLIVDEDRYRVMALCLTKE